MRQKIKPVSIFIINLFIFVSTLVITIIGIIAGPGAGQVGGESMTGINYFKPYTVDSNVLMGLIALLYLIFFIIKFFKKKEIPHWVNIIYLIGTSALALTFITVLAFLAPVAWASSGDFTKALTFYTNDMFFFHFFNPILAVISLFLIYIPKPFKLRDNFLSMIPTFIYSIFYLLNVAVFKTMNDFYGFMFDGKYYLIPVVLLVMYGVIFLIAFILIKSKNAIYKKEENIDN